MDYVRILKQADIFYDLSDTQLQMVASLCGERHCKMGETIFEEQSASDDLYVIARGEVDILINPGIVGAQPAQAEPVTIATLRSGQIFGEIALVDQGLRSAGARSASNDTLLLVIPREKLLSLCDTYPDLGYRIMRNVAADLAMKMRNADLTIRQHLLWGAQQYR